MIWVLIFYLGTNSSPLPYFPSEIPEKVPKQEMPEIGKPFTPPNRIWKYPAICFPVHYNLGGVKRTVFWCTGWSDPKKHTPIEI